MKRFLVTNLLVASVAVASACGDYGTHNYYMLSLDPLEDTYSTINERTDQFWKTYTSGQVTSYNDNRDEVMAVAQQKGDKEMMAYLKALNLYLDNCGDLYNTWDYPTKERKEQIRSDFYSIFAQAAEYEGTRLKAQYALLQMRANMQLKRHQQNKSFWENTASKMPASVYKEMMENIYAGALFNLGERNAAAEIFARQGDRNSITWALRSYRNLAGIKKIYGDNPKSIALAYLVSEFVNSVQETLDSESDEWIKMVGKVPLNTSEARNFITFANQVIGEKKTDNPCMWKTAVGMLNYLLKNQSQAETDMAEAVKLNGPQRSKDNARCVRLLVMAASPTAKSDFLVSELKWLEQKAASERESDYCFNNALDRIYMQEMVDKYKKAGNTNMMLSAIAYLTELNNKKSEYHYRSSKSQEKDWNGDYIYSSLYFEIDELSAEVTEAYFNFLTQSHSDALENYFCQGSYKDANYWNDIIGTKYLGEAKFDKAAEFLKKVDVAFLSKQNISYYLANRDFTIEKWFKRQKSPGEWYDGTNDGMNKGRCTSHPKLKYCQEMEKLMQSYKKSTDMEECRKAAYQLAVRLYQASYKGDCWYISDYGFSSSTDSCKTWQKDFVALADDYLSVSAATADPDLKLKSLFALSYIAPDWWREPIHDESTWKVVGYKDLEESKKFKALDKLSHYVKYGGAPKADYISRCDVIRQFSASR